MGLDYFFHRREQPRKGEQGRKRTGRKARASTRLDSREVEVVHDGCEWRLRRAARTDILGDQMCEA